jgi:hypothetical protein
VRKPETEADYVDRPHGSTARPASAWSRAPARTIATGWLQTEGLFEVLRREPRPITWIDRTTGERVDAKTGEITPGEITPAPKGGPD